MSVVAVRIGKDGYDISSDSQMTLDNSLVASGEKLFEINNMVFGFCGSMDDVTLMKIFASKNKLKQDSEDGIVQFMSNYYQYLMDITHSDVKMESDFIIGTKKNIYLIQGWTVRKITDFDATGSGRDYALTALALGHSTEKAIEIACKYDLHCGLPVKTIHVQY